ncbi:MAG TPA: RpiB/LacA/LacB family sugar-phosphate isomerase [Anaerolineales bacterium]|nr:RpiB/LacA/LacB family sugar-phosphate isomerase [Anaerolineales bacterium]
MRIAVGSDEKTALTDVIVEELKRRGHELSLVGPLAGEKKAWPAVARKVAEAVAEGRAEEGVLFCWTGTGVSLAANKVPGIRAALCDDAETARGARLWDNANILCLSLRRASEAVAKEILETWFSTSYKPNPEDDAALAELEAIEERHRRRGA